MPEKADRADSEEHPPSPGGQSVNVLLSVECDGWGDEAYRHAQFTRAFSAALETAGLSVKHGLTEISVLLTGDEAVRALNMQWRGKDKPTNVLSFPAFDLVPGDALPPMLGDIVIAQGVVAAEAAAESKTFDDHLGHLAVHGFLHLAGWDHQTDEEAEAMEALERDILADLDIADPYGDLESRLREEKTASPRNERHA